MPFKILYLLSDIAYFLLYHIIGYRKAIVMNNLLIAFPQKTLQERILISKQFYKNLADTFIETIKMITLSEKEFLKRCDGNFEVLSNVIEKGKNIQLQGAHQFNWEYGNWILAMKVNLPVASVYMPIKNKPLNRIFLKVRERFGAVLVDATDYSKNIKKVSRKQHALALVADQNPGWPPGRVYWLNFFSRPAPFLMGPEKGAMRSNNALVFTMYKKLKRGHYYFENNIIAENAAECKPGEITRKFRDFIQQAITQDPASFLWSHKRWKHTYTPKYEHMWIDYVNPIIDNS